MSRRPSRDNAADDYGVRSPHQTMCGKCDHQINDFKRAYKASNGKYFHKACAPGADDDQGNPHTTTKPSSEVPRSEWWS